MKYKISLIIFLIIIISFSIFLFKFNKYTIEKKMSNIFNDNNYATTSVYIRFNNMKEYHTFLVYKKTATGYLAVLDDVYTKTSFSTPTHCYQGGCNDGTEIFTSSNHNLGTLLNQNFISLMPSNYKDYINFANWSVGDSNANQTGSAYIGLVSYTDYNNMKDNSFFNNIDQPYWLANTNGESPYRIYVYDNGALVASAPNVISAYARPVIEIKKDLKITSGNGDENNPYLIG